MTLTLTPTIEFQTPFHDLSVLSPSTANALRLTLELLVQEREEIRAIEEEKKRKRAERRLAKQANQTNQGETK